MEPVSKSYLDYLGEKLYAKPQAVEAIIELYRRMNQNGPK